MLNHSIQYLAPDHFSIFYIRDSNWKNEKNLITQWFQIPIGKKMVTKEGDAFVVIDHGKVNKNRGPDIKNSVIFIGHRFISGDIECHILEQDWYYHRHHKDDEYNHVVLHITHSLSQSHRSPVKHTLVFDFIEIRKCPLTRKNVSNSYSHTLIHLSEKRWKQHLLTVSKGNSPLIFAKILGKGGNERHFHRLVSYLDLEKIIELSLPESLQYIQAVSNWINIPWEHCGIRPAHWPEKRFSLLVELLKFNAGQPLMDNQNSDHFFSRLATHCPTSGKGILIECAINYFYPFFALEGIRKNNMEIYSYWKSIWQNLQLLNSLWVFDEKFRTYFFEN